MSKALEEVVSDLTEMIFILEGEAAELSVHPASSSSHDGIRVVSKLFKDVLLEHALSTGHIVLRLCHVSR